MKRKNARLRKIELLDLEALTKKDPLVLRKIHLSCSTVNSAAALGALLQLLIDYRVASFYRHVRKENEWKLETEIFLLLSTKKLYFF